MRLEEEREYNKIIIFKIETSIRGGLFDSSIVGWNLKAIENGGGETSKVNGGGERSTEINLRIRIKRKIGQNSCWAIRRTGCYNFSCKNIRWNENYTKIPKKW